MKIGHSGKTAEFRLIFDHSPTALLLVSRNGSIELANHAAERLFGYRRAELLGQHIGVLVPTLEHTPLPEEHTDFSAAPLTHSRAEGREFFAVHRNGQTFTADIGSSPIETAAGAGLIVGITDISAHKQMEIALQQNAALVESSHDAIIGKTLDGKITSWNPAAQLLFGYSAEEAMGKPIVMVFPPDRLDEEQEFLRRIARGETITRYDTVRVRKDGSTVEVSVTLAPIRDKTGCIVGASKIAHDISSRRQSEQSLRQYAAIVESSDDAIIGKTIDGIITSWNSGAEHIFGFSRAEAFGASILLIVPELYQQEELMLLERVRKGEPVNHYETVRRHKDGRLIDISVSISPIRNHRGDIVGAAKIARKLNDESLRANHQLLDAIIKLLPIGLWILDSDGKIIFSNTAADRTWAISPGVNRLQLSDYRGWRRDSALSTAGHDWAGARAVNHGETTIEEEIEIECFDGGNKVILDSALPIRRLDGSVRGAVAIQQDITNRKQDEIQQRKLIEQLIGLNDKLFSLTSLQTAILENAAYAVIATDENLVVTLFNPAAEALLGYSAAELIEQETPRLFHDGDEIKARAVELSEELGTVIEPGMGVFVAKARLGQEDAREWTYIRKDGSRFAVWLTITTLCNQKGAIVGYLGIANDLAPRKLAEAALQESEVRFRGAFQNAPIGMALFSVSGDFMRVNPALCEILGYDEAELLKKDFRSITHPDDLSESLSLRDDLIAGRLASCHTEKRYFHKNLSVLWVSITLFVVRDSKGVLLYFVGQILNITERRRAEAELHASQKMLARTGAIALVGGWEIDLIKRGVTWSDEIVRLHDCEPGFQPSLDQAVSFLSPKSRAQIDRALQDAIHHGQGFDLQLELVSAKGRAFFGRAIGTVEFEQGEPVRVVGAFQDVTELRKIERELVESHELMRVTLDSIGDAVITTDADGKVDWLNPVAEGMTGWSKEEASNRPLAEIFVIINAETRQICQNPVEICLRENKVVALAKDTNLVSKDGGEFGIEDSASPIRNDQGLLLGAVLVFRDVSEQRRLSREMGHRATHDGLTGLVNRSEFDILLSHLMLDRRAESHVMLYIDLDEFKVVNDTCGHDAGDQLLRQVSELVSKRVRARDRVARLGGDEFGVILERCSIAEGHQIAQKICDEIDLFRFSFDGRRFRIGASIGVVPIDHRWDSSAEVMKAADSCCYAAKEAGRHRVHLWEESDDKLKTRQSEAQWVNRLESAMEDDQLLLYGQCIEPIKGSSAGLHCEVLLRLNGPDGKIILPGTFLPAAERFHLVSRIDRWVLRRVFAQLAMANSATDQIEMIAINLSGQSMSDRLFQCDVIRMIGEANFDVRKLCFEITETAAITNFGEAQRFIKDVRAFGVKIALDDFGAGASSFGYLRQLAVDILKIDGQFITGMLENPLDHAAVKCFCEVAKVVGAKTIAEFVERADVRKALRRIGVDMVQGFLMHQAEPLTRLLPQLA